ncbi:MAG: glycosyltransferase [Lachnospiraceae bacterium]|nr:glycosyltransferase [Lachnospiraceae bacterium]
MNLGKEQNFVSAVIYVRNNSSVLEGFLNHVYSKLGELFNQFEIVCVNDASTDNSEAVIKECAKAYHCAVTIVNMGYVQGVELAMNAGCDMAIGDFVFEFDSANQTWPENMMEQLYRKMQEGYDIVSACPKGKMKFSSKLFYSVFNKFSNIKEQLRTEAFRLTSRRAINRASSMNQAQMYRKAVNANLALAQTYVEFEPTGENRIDKQSSKERTSLAVDSLILFTDIGYKIAFVMSIVMLAFAAIVGIYTVIIYATGHPVEGWTPIMIFLAIGFFVLFAILTFVIKYLSLILNLNFRRQRYVVESTERL